MRTSNDILGTIDSYIGSANRFVYFLLGTGIFFTFFLKFPLIRSFRHVVIIVRGTYDKKTDVGYASYFQTFSTSLSGNRIYRQYRGRGTCNSPGRTFCAFLDAENSLPRDGDQIYSGHAFGSLREKDSKGYSNEKVNE
jgi:hypothetical protein